MNNKNMARVRASLAMLALCGFSTFGVSPAMSASKTNLNSGYNNTITDGKHYQTAVGSMNTTGDSADTAIGFYNTAKGGNSSAVGDCNTAEGVAASAMGSNNTASGKRSNALGFANSTSKDYDSAVGAGNTASGSYSSSVGVVNTASGQCSSALGYANFASNTVASAVGAKSVATGYGSVAMGFASYAGADGATAIGVRAVATEAGTVSFGHKSGEFSGYYQDSEGNLSPTKVDDTYTEVNYDSDSFARLTNIAEGQDDNDAVNVKQLKEVVNEKIDNVNEQVSDMVDNRMGDIRNDINKVGAGAAALAALHPETFNPDDKWSFAVGFGHYKNANAGAFGAFYKPNQDTTVSIGSTIGNGVPMMNAGVSFKLGARSKGASIYSSNVELVREINTIRKDNEMLRKVNADQAKEIGNLKADNAQMKEQIAQILKKLELSDTVKKTAAVH